MEILKKTKQKKVECIRKLDNCYVEVITDTKLDSYQLRFAYFEKNCRKKCTQQSRRYPGWFWVNWSSKKIERMTREAIDACLRVLKESKKVGSTATVSGTVYSVMRFHVTLGIDACTFFLTAFLEIAVYIWYCMISIEITSFFKTINDWWSKSCFELTHNVTLIKVFFCFYWVFFNSVWLVRTLYTSETNCYKNSSCLKGI